MTLSPKLGVVEIRILWHFRLPLPIQMFINVDSSPRLSGIGMPSPILWSHPLKMQKIVLLSSLLWWELGTNSLITGPGVWLSFRRFTSKLSWSWSWTPTVVLNHSTVPPLNRTALWALSYRFSMARIMLALMLYFLIAAHKVSCHTLSEAFLNKNRKWDKKNRKWSLWRHGRDSADISRWGSWDWIFVLWCSFRLWNRRLLFRNHLFCLWLVSV